MGVVCFWFWVFFGGCGFTAVIGVPGRRGKNAPMLVEQCFLTKALGMRREKRKPRSRGKHMRERVKKEVLSWLGEDQCQRCNLCCHTISMSTIFSRAAESRQGIHRDAHGFLAPVPRYLEWRRRDLSRCDAVARRKNDAEGSVADIDADTPHQISDARPGARVKPNQAAGKRCGRSSVS